MNCTKCDRKLEENSKFCANCGNPITTNNENISTTLVSNTGQNKKWWQYKKMGARELGTASLVLILLGIYSFFDSGSSSLLIIGLLFTIAWAFAKRRTASKNNKPTVLFNIIIVITIILFVLPIAFISLNLAREKGNTSMCPQLSSNSQNDKWVVYYSATPHFCAKFPSYPVHDTNTHTTPNGSMQVDTYKSVDDTGSIMYAINVTEILPSVDLSDPSVTLNNSIDFAGNNMNEKVLSSRHTSHNGYPAIDYLVQGGGTSKIRGLHVLVGHQLYALVSAYDTQDEPNLEFDKFASQLSIL